MIWLPQLLKAGCASLSRPTDAAFIGVYRRFNLSTNPRQQVARRRVQEAGGADDGFDGYPAGGGGAYLADDPGRFTVGAAADDEQGFGGILRGHDDEHLAFVGHLEDVQAQGLAGRGHRG